MLEIINNEPLSVEVTTRCGSRCQHCFARAGLKKETSMSLETARTIIEEGYALGYRNLHITGGEPFLWPHFFGFIESALNTGYDSIFCNTNGKLLTEKNCSLLKKTGGRLTFSVSLQGYPRFHDSVRGEGAFEAASAGIKNALEAGLKLFIFTTAGKSLLKTLPRFTEFVFGEFNGIAGLTFIQLIRVYGDEPDLRNELLEPEDFIEMTRALSLLGLCGYSVDILENPLASVVSEAEGMGRILRSPPLHRPGKLVVLADKNITLSHSSRESLGLYGPGKLESVLKSNQYIKSFSPDKKTCPGCKFRENCRKYGIIRPSEWFRNPGEGEPFCRRVLEEIYKASSS